MSRPAVVQARLAWLQALADPAVTAGWTLADWQQAIRLGRRLRLLARLAAAIGGAGLTDRVPPQVGRHLLAEQRLSDWRTSAMEWALDRVAQALAPLDHPLVLLKGAAYIGQRLAIAQGRMPSDVDVLVPLARLASVQARLLAAGWEEVPLDDHDRRYYHEWSHEVPPMRHPAHNIELDLHHNILPPLARTHVDADLLLACVQPSLRWPAWQVLQPVDQVLHSAAHLFNDSEARDRVRDLIDLDGLLRHFGASPLFWSQLPERALQLGLQEPLALACHFCTEWLDTPVPARTLDRVVALGPSSWRRRWLLPLLHTILLPADPDGNPPWQQDLAASIFLARYHRNRMPLRLLLPHLWHKLGASRATAPPGDNGG